MPIFGKNITYLYGMGCNAVLGITVSKIWKNCTDSRHPLLPIPHQKMLEIQDVRGGDSNFNRDPIYHMLWLCRDM